MSDLESYNSNYGLEDPQWMCMVTLFIASLVTILLYLVQYFQHGGGGSQERPPQINAAKEEADAFMGWALSLKSWKSQWRGAWCSALNEESRKSGGPVLTFEEDGLLSSELTVSQVCSFQKGAGHKAACCKVDGKNIQFSLSAAPPVTSTAESHRYTVRIAAVEMQRRLYIHSGIQACWDRITLLVSLCLSVHVFFTELDLDMQDAGEDMKVCWGVSQLETRDLHLTPNFTQDHIKGSSVPEVKEKIRQLLCKARPSVWLSCRPAQASEIKEAHNKVVSPPKPPRAHDWKLLVKNLRVTLRQEDNSAGSMNPLCVLQLDDPPQKFSTPVLRNTSTPSWDQPFIFELNGRSKVLNILLLNDRQPHDSTLLGQAAVPLDLVKKQPARQQTFALMTNNLETGSLTTEFTYLEPSEVRSWQPPTPAPTRRVEMDRTVMPCGTVVTTITAVKSKPGRPPPAGLILEPSLKATPSKSKLSERRVSEQPSTLGHAVSKALSSSDTELLVLNGTDPVAEAAIRQLSQSARQKLKSPVKKSTIIISGITKAPLSQDDELALMADYAAAMDASMSKDSSAQDVNAAIVSGPSSTPEESEPQEGPSGIGRPPDDWGNHAGEELDHSSLSMCVSEASCKKRGSFLQKGARLFFRRRHQRKEPGMSQSHNDLVYLEPPATVDRASRTATLSRMLNRKLLPKHKSKANGSTSLVEPHV